MPAFVPSHSSQSWVVPLMIAGLWTPAMIAASYAWRFGEYYDYGWFVPPAAAWLLARRWLAVRPGQVDLPWRWVAGIGVAVGIWFLLLRVLGQADPAWRMPMILLALTAAVCSHGLIAIAAGWRVSASFVWISLLALSAVPWPTWIERQLVEHLTHAVMHTAVEWFRLAGRPVEIEGVRIFLHDMQVEVTDGCSGVRSFQSFVMATWFFAELQRMRASRVLALLGFACVAAFVVNTARAWALATIRFDHGVEAFDNAHDWLGIAAFVVSGLMFYFVSGWLAQSQEKRQLRRIRNHPKGEDRAQ